MLDERVKRDVMALTGVSIKRENVLSLPSLILACIVVNEP